jgi:hypothetical protein
MNMLLPSTPFWGLPCGVPRFWRLRVAKDFPKPEYYIGQTVLHRAKVVNREVFAHVDVLGISWTGGFWQYLVEFPSNHPWCSPDGDMQWVDSRELTPVFTSVNLIEIVGGQKQKLIVTVLEQSRKLNSY